MDFISGPFTDRTILMVLSMFLWKVTFEGNNRYTDDALMTYLEKAGIHPGILETPGFPQPAGGTDPSGLSRDSGVSAQISGTQLSIKLRENDPVFSVPKKMPVRKIW